MDLEGGKDTSTQAFKSTKRSGSDEKGERTITLAELPTTLADQLEELDEDGNGIVSLDEIREGVKRLRNAKEQLGLAKKVIIFLAVLTLVQVSAIVGVVYALLVSLKDTDVNNNNQLVVKGTDEPVTVANPDIRLGPSNYTSPPFGSASNARVLQEGLHQIVDTQGNPVSVAPSVGADGQVVTPQGDDAAIAVSKYTASASELGGLEGMFEWTLEQLDALESVRIVLNESSITLAVKGVDFRIIHVNNSLARERAREEHDQNGEEYVEDVDSTFEALLVSVEHYKYEMLFLLRVYETGNSAESEYFIWMLDEIEEAEDLLDTLEHIRFGGLTEEELAEATAQATSRRVLCSFRRIRRCFRKIRNYKKKISRLESEVRDIRNQYNTALSTIRSFARISKRAGQNLAQSISNLQGIRDNILQVPALMQNILLAYEWVPSQCSILLTAIEQILLNEVGKQCIPYDSIFPNAFGSSITVYEKPEVFKMEANLQPVTCFDLVEFRPTCPSIQALLSDMDNIIGSTIADAFVVLDDDIRNMLNLQLLGPLDSVISSLRNIEDSLAQISSRRRLGKQLTSESATESEILLSQVYEHCHSYVEKEIHKQLEHAARHRKLLSLESFGFDALRIKVETRMSASMSFEGQSENFYSVDLLRELAGGALPFVTQASIPLFPALSLAVGTTFDVRLLFQTYMSASAQGTGAVSTGGLTFDVDIAKGSATVTRGDPSRDFNLAGTARTSISLGIDFQPTASVGICVGLGSAVCLTTEIFSGVGGAIGGDQIIATSVGVPHETAQLSTFFTPDVSYKEQGGSCILGADSSLTGGGAWAHFPPPFARAKLKAPGLNEDLFQWEHTSPLASTVLFQQCTQGHS
uniref:EF-hand domain-containing protein n=1 Tax=Picocystis salinarum TaxID=88271 RepID=A0A7S3UE83_9CHLO|mmetsp:Transcript_5868/g.36382  ORF Transcript_5868/g.36382 Transcript_5868/m.36382 type:complete len:866 (+) Transcript_5868:439-3036(+)|eukprot:CAMPEP_0183830178 /NCGR_PEP_ID=MMETSP0807_2-20130328/3869_1 /TAXON_ID=88271 /ORGANISM="Picocystis salinarum, Strain CCMP1897" /LENGTH=865 /DNA_ID=CAMNT_0026075527 /DNA_START=360 /DNA_END=2957 /DNA_ORIENTATION=+